MIAFRQKYLKHIEQLETTHAETTEPKLRVGIMIENGPLPSIVVSDRKRVRTCTDDIQLMLQGEDHPYSSTDTGTNSRGQTGVEVRCVQINRHLVQEEERTGMRKTQQLFQSAAIHRQTNRPLGSSRVIPQLKGKRGTRTSSSRRLSRRLIEKQVALYIA